MIKTLVAQTEEIDDIQAAIIEIKKQLNLEENLKKNSVGIIACHYEFVLSKMVKALCEALPFDVVGTITTAQAVNDQSGTLLFTMMVLTSDTEEFVTTLTPSLSKEPGRVIEEAYIESAKIKGDERPALILAYAPFMLANSGDEYVNVITKASGGVPCFGTLSVDDTLEFSNCFSIYNGEDYRDSMAMVLIYGDISPRFYIATISQEKIVGKPAKVTKSSGHILMEVNDRPVVDYFSDLGLTKASETQYAMSSLPFMLDYEDNTPSVSKVFIGLTPEKYAICAGAMPEGSTLYIGVFDKQDVLLTTGNAIESMKKEMQNASGLLIYSCISRNMSMGANLLDELDLVKDNAGGLPFMMAYSGGEICPTQVSETRAVNRFHNNAFVACLF